MRCVEIVVTVVTVAIVAIVVEGVAQRDATRPATIGIGVPRPHPEFPSACPLGAPGDGWMDEGANPSAETSGDDCFVPGWTHDTFTLFSPLPFISELRRLSRWLLAVGCWMSVVGYWLLAVGC